MPDTLVAYGLDDRVATLYDSFEDPTAGDLAGDPFLTRIVRVDRTSCLAVARHGSLRLDVAGAWSRRAGVTEVATGDWVVAREVAATLPAAVGVLARRSAVVRRTPEDRSRADQVLAANVDVLAVISTLDRPSAAARVERLLVLAWESGALPVVVMTKSDVAIDLDGARREVSAAAAGVEVLVTSAATGEGAGELAALAGPGRTLAFLGPSGAGKSSLVNLLSGGAHQRVGDVRGLDRRGKHTTTARELVPVPGGGVLLDTPGLRSLGLIDAAAGLSATFGDVEAVAAGCRFADCRHGGEPGCAIAAAVAGGALDLRRVESYQKLLRELAREERRQPGPAGRAARRAHAEHWARTRRQSNAPRMDERRQGRR